MAGKIVLKTVDYLKESEKNSLHDMFLSVNDSLPKSFLEETWNSIFETTETDKKFFLIYLESETIQGFCILDVFEDYVYIAQFVVEKEKLEITGKNMLNEVKRVFWDRDLKGVIRKTNVTGEKFYKENGAQDCDFMKEGYDSNLYKGLIIKKELE